MQSPSEYEEGGKKIADHLETEGKGDQPFSYEQSGETTTDDVTSSSEVEIKA